MPSKPKGLCSVVAVDPGTTSGLLVVSVDPRWLRGLGVASWDGLGAAVKFRAPYQVGREPKRFDPDSGRVTRLDRVGIDEHLMPILAQGQPLLTGGGLRDDAFYRLLDGEDEGKPRADLSVVDAGELLQVRQIAGLLDNYPDAALVIEDFTLRTQSKDREALSAARLRLAIQCEEALHGEGRIAFLQQPSIMSQAPDERLRRAGLHFRGMQHATDAGRHVAMFLRRCRSDEALRTQAFPRHFAQNWDEDDNLDTLPLDERIRNGV